MGVLAWLGREHARGVAIIALVLSLLLIANAALVNSLSYSTAGP
jgi:hypothetical protein